MTEINVTDTTPSFFLNGPTTYTLAVAGTWNGGNARLERHDSRRWLPALSKPFSKDETRTVRLDHGNYRLMLGFDVDAHVTAADLADAGERYFRQGLTTGTAASLSAAAVKAAENAAGYGVIAGDPAARALAASLVATVRDIHAAVMDRRPGAAIAGVPTAVQQAGALAADKTVKAETGASTYARAAVDGVNALRLLAAPTGVRLAIKEA
ncbi:MAG: hypothetical protein JO001_25080 [Alphaproteobacteria bacterium]|nr:hypothetical protein [Alphaproteobacteria bacterium]